MHGIWMIYYVQGVVEGRVWDRREDSNAGKKDVVGKLW